MCQWGARGRALAGQSAEQIVSAYYTGATVVKSVSPDTTMRVLVHTAFQPETGASGQIAGKGGAWQLEGSGVPAIQAPAGAILDLSYDAGAPRYRVTDPSGTALGAGPLRAPLVLRPLEGGTRFVVGYKPAPAVNGRPAIGRTPRIGSRFAVASQRVRRCGSPPVVTVTLPLRHAPSCSNDCARWAT